jgi:hypothetical protein
VTTPCITGSWIDVIHGSQKDGVYWNRKTLAYSDAEWDRLVGHLKNDLGITLLMLQNVARDGGAVYPSKVLEWQWKTVNCRDPLGAIMAACDRHGVDFFPGIGFPTSAGVVESDSAERLDWYERVSVEFLEMYGAHRCFKGWYVAAEASVTNGAFVPEHVAFTSRIRRIWRRLTPALPAVASPYFFGPRTIADAGRFADDIVRMGCDIIAYQDGVGICTGRSLKYPAADNAPVFEALAKIHSRTGVKLWANIELFVFENSIIFQPLLPAPWPRVREQLEAAAPFVDRVVAYTVPGLMTSQSICPGLGVPETEPLCQAYRQYRATVQEATHGRT